MTPCGTHVASIDQGDGTFLLAEHGEGLHDETEGQLRSEGKVIGMRKVVGCHAEEAGIAVACESRRQVSIRRVDVRKPNGTLTLIDSNELGGSERCGHARAGHVGLIAVQLLVNLLHGDGGGDVVGVNANAHLARDALSSRVGRLRNAVLGLLVRGGRVLWLLLLLLHVLRRRLLVTLRWALLLMTAVPLLSLTGMRLLLLVLLLHTRVGLRVTLGVVLWLLRLSGRGSCLMIRAS